MRALNHILGRLLLAIDRTLRGQRARVSAHNEVHGYDHGNDKQNLGQRVSLAGVRPTRERADARAVQVGPTRDYPTHARPGGDPRRAGKSPQLAGWIREMVGVRGFEPPTPASRPQCATRLRYTPTVKSRSPWRGTKRKTRGIAARIVLSSKLRGDPLSQYLRSTANRVNSSRHSN